MKRLLTFLLCMLFVTSFITALEFDNVKEYDNVTREVTIINAFGLGDDIGKARLNSEPVVRVASGYQKVAEFDLWAYQDYNDALKGITLYNRSKEDWINHPLDRDIDLKYKTYRDKKVDDYADVIVGYLPNGTAITEYQKVGSHFERQEVWNDLLPVDLMKNDFLTIGLFTNVKIGDHVEWIPTIYGVEVEEWAEWTSDLNVSLRSYYKLDDNDLSDNFGNSTFDLTNAATTNTTGKINSARDFTPNQSMTGSYNEITGTTARTINMWIYNDDTGNYRDFLTYGTESANQFFHWRKQNNESMWFQSQGTDLLSNQTIPLATWQMITITFDGVNRIRLYQDGVLTGDSTAFGSLNTGTTNGMFWGTYRNIDEWWDGKMDEIGIWTRALNDSEIALLYNGGDGLPLGFTDTSSPPSITFNSPAAQNYTTGPQTLSFNFTAWDDVNLTSVQLYINAALNQTNASGINNSNYIFNVTLGDGTYQVFGRATDNDSFITDTETRTYIIDSILPSVNITSPADPYTVTQFNESVQVNWTINDTNLDTCWYEYPYFVPVENNSFDNTVNPIWNFTNTSLTYGYNIFATINDGQTDLITNVPSDCFIEYTKISANTLFPSGNTTLNCFYENGSDIQFLNKYYGSLTSISFMTLYPKRYTISSCSLNTTTINYPSDNPDNATFYLFANDTLGNENNDSLLLVKSTDAPNITIYSPVTNYALLNNGTSTIDLNYSISDPNLDTCWYTYNNANYTVNCTQNTTFVYVGGVNTLTLFANDTLGNINSLQRNWTVNATNESVIYSSPVPEGSSQTFLLNISVNSSLNVIDGIVFWYDNTAYDTSSWSVSGGNYQISTPIVIPDVVNDTNITFYWQLDFTNGNQLNTTNYNQTVNALFIDDCSTYNVTIFNFTMYDEQTQSKLNGTGDNTLIEVDLGINSTDRSVQFLSFNKSYVQTNPALICINTNLTQTYYYDLQVLYSSTDREEEFYYVQNSPINNATTPINISLYDLNTTVSTLFKINYKGSQFIPVAGALIQLQRKYIGEGTFKTVEVGLTDDSGNAKAHFQIEGAVYTLIVTKNGTTLDIFPNIAVICESPITEECVINLNSLTTVTEITDWSSENGITYTMQLSSDESSVQVPFVSSSGLPVTVQINTTLFGTNEQTLVCTDTVIASSGTATCSIPSSYNNKTIVSTIYVGGVTTGVQSFSLRSSLRQDLGTDTYFFVFVLMITIPFLFISSTIGMVIAVILGLIISGGLLFIESTGVVSKGSAVVWLIVAGCVIIYKLAKRDTI